MMLSIFRDPHHRIRDLRAFLFKSLFSANLIARVSQGAQAVRIVSQIIAAGKDLEDVLEFFV
jgi:hypothetical protein